MTFTRNNSKIRPLLKEVIEEDIFVYYPIRFIFSGLANNKTVLGVVMVSDINGNYTVLNLPVQVEFNSVETNEVDIDGVKFKRMTIEKGGRLFKHNKYIPSLDDTYAMLEDWIIMSNNIPFYIDYQTLLDVQLKSYRLIGGTLGKDILSISILISIIARDKTSNEFYRLKKGELKWVGLSDKNLSYNNLTSMIGPGTNLEKGINAGLNLDIEDNSTLSKVFDS